MNEEYNAPTKEELALQQRDWNDLTDLQKIERQRGIIKGLQQTVIYVQQQLSQLQLNFNQHQHSDRGIMIPIMNNNLLGSATSGIAKRANSNYF